MSRKKSVGYEKEGYEKEDSPQPQINVTIPKEKSQEEMYHERKAKYLANVAKRKAKEDKKAKMLKELEGED